MSDKIVKSACGVANLLAAITGEPRRNVQERLGLRPVRLCSMCNGPIDPYSKSPFCSEECRHRWFWPLVECEECHKLKEVKRAIIARADKHYEHFFCSHKCAGAYVGRVFGFSAHPERAGRRAKLTGQGLANRLRV